MNDFTNEPEPMPEDMSEALPIRRVRRIPLAKIRPGDILIYRENLIRLDMIEWLTTAPGDCRITGQRINWKGHNTMKLTTNESDGYLILRRRRDKQGRFR